MVKPKAHDTKHPSKKSADQDGPKKAAAQESPGTPPNQDLPVAPARPSGKLGLIVDRLATSAGVTADELGKATGWQRHTVLGALSRLRARGFVMRLEPEGDRKIYRLERSEG